MAMALELAGLEPFNRVSEGTAWDRRPYTAPPGPEAAPWIPPRDWGRDNFFVPWVSYSSDYGVFLGGGVSVRRFRMGSLAIKETPRTARDSHPLPSMTVRDDKERKTLEAIAARGDCQAT